MAEASSSTADGPGECAALDRLLTRLALTEDSQLEKVLSKLLPLAIARLGSSHHPTKQKVMEILTHINKRIKDQASIKLPLGELLKLYGTPDGAPMVKSFALVYVEMAFDRTSVENRAETVPLLLSGIASMPAQHQDMLLRMAAKGLEIFASQRVEQIFVQKCSFAKAPLDGELFLGFCLQTLLYQPPSEGTAVTPAGLSSSQCSRISGKNPLKGDQLMLRKLGILNIVAELELTVDTVYPLFLVASSDSNDRVSKRGDELMKRKAAGANLENPALIQRLFSIFEGTPAAATIAAEHRVSPASSSVKTKIMATFTRSVAAANAFPSTLQCVFDCIYGISTTARLKQAGMEFAVWIFKHAADEQLKPMAPLILTGLVKVLDGQTSNETDASSKQLRSFTYQAIGQLAQRAAHLFNVNSEMAVRLFGAVRTEPSSTRSILQEALTSLAAAYKGCTGPVADDIEALLLKNIKAEESEARFSATVWATRLYSFNHAPSRFLCMLGVADSKLDIREMAQQALTPVQSEPGAADFAAAESSEELPSLRSMMEYICQQQPGVLAPPVLNEKLLFSPKTYTSMISFVQKCYEKEINFVKSASAHKGKELYFPSLDAFRMLLEHGMAFDGTVELHCAASNGLLALATHNADEVAGIYGLRMAWLKQFLGHIDSSTREAISRLIGIATGALTTDDTLTLIAELTTTLSKPKARFEDLDGALRATGYVLAQCMTGIPEVSKSVLVSATSALLEVTRTGNSALAGSAAEALGHLGLRGSIPLPLGDLPSLSSSVPALSSLDVPDSGRGENISRSLGSSEEIGKGAATVIQSAPGKAEPTLSLVLSRLAELIASKEVKVVQKAVLAYGHISFGESNPEVSQVALTTLFTLCRSKTEDILFTVGEALSFIWGAIPISADKILRTNYVSLSFSSNFLSGDTLVSAVDSDMHIDDGTGHARDSAQERILTKLFEELLFSSRKEERCAGSVWLLSLITYCGRHPKLQNRLPEIQEGFSHLLGEQNDLTQEMASRGMSIVYELGDTATKEQLVLALVSTLSGTAKKKRAVKLMEDSEVFEEGAMGEKPGGGSISTYKELCNIANEMGQPDLIYKFMDLANHQASLNSKRGAAFGFAKIAKQAGEALRPHLSALVPKLFRYQYDPNKRIQDAMGHIWRSLVAEPKKAVDEYLDNILEDLLVQAGSRLWRSRESACLALGDVIQGRRFNEVGKYLERIWIMGFRAMDDIKETVRTAGDSLCRSISSLTLRLCDISLSPEGDTKAALAIVLPFLLSKGILSTVGDVRRLSIQTIMKLVKGSGGSIRPHMPDLVVCMLESLSSLEDQRLNYAELHAERAGISTEKLENVRIAVSKDSPMWDTLDFCIKQVDMPTLNALVPRLVQQVRSGVGLNTRVGVAKFISQLTQRVGAEMKPHTATLVKVIFSAVQAERSTAGKKAFASACAAVARFSDEPQYQKLVVNSVALYNSSGDKDTRLAGALVLKELSHQASDVLKGYYAVVLPVAFIARFDEEKDLAGIFEEMWEENTSSASVALRLYMSDILPHLRDGIASSSWPRKQKAAKAIASIAEVAGEVIGPFSELLLQDLLAELPGRLWEGKEAVLDAIGKLCKGCSRTLSAASSVRPETVVAAVSAACGRKKKLFRDAAMVCLEQVLKAFENQDLFEQVAPMLMDACMQPPPRKSAVLSPDTVTDLVSADADELIESSLSVEKVLACLTACIEGAKQSTVRAFGKTVTAAVVATLSLGHSWQVKLAALSAGKSFLKKLCSDAVPVPETSTAGEWLDLLVPSVLDCISFVKVAQVHVEAMELVIQVVELHKSGWFPEFSRESLQSLHDRLTEMQSSEKNANARSLLARAISLLGEQLMQG